MLQEYFGAGIVLIDKPRYERFFGPSIKAANTTYREERDRYIEDLAISTAEQLDHSFERSPDLEKPFFVQQMGWKLAASEQQKAEAARKEAEVAKQKANQMTLELAQVRRDQDTELGRRQRVRQRQLAAEERNLGDPKHLRKRKRQAKKRDRKHRH